MQTRKGSLLEITLNIGTGFVISWMITMVILPAFGYPVNSIRSFQITMIYTMVSIVRSYIFRRIFNAITIKNNCPHD